MVAGRGLIGTVFPGCPETYQSFQQQAETYMQGTMSESQQRLRDEHQKVRRFQQGDIIALPPGVTHWCYNDGDLSVVAIQVFDTSNTANQLEPMRRVSHVHMFKPMHDYDIFFFCKFFTLMIYHD